MNTEPHEPSDACGDIHCYSHNIDEPWHTDFYMACFECNHVFPTEQALIDDDRSAWVAMGGREPWPRSADEISCCPHCVHDF